MIAWRPANITVHRAWRRGPNNKGGATMTSYTYLDELAKILDDLSPVYIRKVIIYATTLLKIQRERESHHDDDNADNHD